MTEAENQDQDQDGGAAPSAEQAADLRALEAAVNEGAAQASSGPQDAPEAAAGPKPPSQSAMAAAGLMVGLLRPIVVYVVPVLKDAPAELWEPVVPGTAGVLDHLGVGESELFSNPWFGLALGVAPLVAYAAMNQPQEDAKPPALEAPAGAGLSAPAPEVPVGTNKVTIGAVVQ